MGCETVRELLGNYIDEDLTETLRGSVDNHPAVCQKCCADIETLRSAIVALKESQDIEQPSPWFTERLLHRLAQESDTTLTEIEQPAKALQLGLW